MKQKLIGMVCAAALALSLGSAASAAVGGFTMTYLSGTSDTVTNMPAADSGVGEVPYSVSSTVPQREGYEFLDWTLDYALAAPETYTVTYVVDPDSTYGVPSDSVTPTDNTAYASGDPVTVANALTTADTSAANPQDPAKTLPGTWIFSGWDTSDFNITADTTITGSWQFVRIPCSFTVRYIDVTNGGYVDIIDPATGKPYTEYGTGYVGDSIIRTRRTFAEYHLESSSRVTRTLTSNDDDNVIVFEYTRLQ